MDVRPIRFYHQGRIVEVDGGAPTRTVLEWLREDQRCTGTKEGCAEGDCGACTVVVGELDAAGALALKPVNACIRFLPTLDGKALFTVEDVQLGERLHPVQQAMVDCHGSQCGFCTPGFVMSMWASYERHQGAGTRPTRQQLADDLAGNLCRCTGYRPILEAGQRMFEAPPVRLDAAPVRAALQTLAADPPLATHDGGFFAPRTLDELATLRAARPEARVFGGSTDVGLWVTKQLRELPPLISTTEVAELKRIDETHGELSIGAAASLEDAWLALVVRWPALRDVYLRFASPPVRHAGTMGGNVANGSPIGDSAPVLMALDARLLLRRGADVRELPLADFYLGYMKNRLEPGEFLQAIVVPAGAAMQLRAYKISKRYDSDISAVLAALAIGLDEAGVVRHARFAFGGMAAVVRRSAVAEAAVIGQPWSQATMQAAQAALAHEFQPLSDMRASAGYRLQVAQNLLQRFWLETRAEAPLAEAEVSVFARMEVTP